jgi:hypothetical protein
MTFFSHIALAFIATAVLSVIWKWMLVCVFGALIAFCYFLIYQKTKSQDLRVCNKCGDTFEWSGGVLLCDRCLQKLLQSILKEME